MRTMEDGSVHFPRRGNPPAAEPLEMLGLTRDKNDPYVFRPTLPVCRHLSNVSVTLPCGKVRVNYWCKHFSSETNPMKCKDCLSKAP